MIDSDHLTAAEVERAVFSLDSVFTGHLAECPLCASMVVREREINPFYPLYLKHPETFREALEEAKQAHEESSHDRR